MKRLDFILLLLLGALMIGLIIMDSRLLAESNYTFLNSVQDTGRTMRNYSGFRDSNNIKGGYRDTSDLQNRRWKDSVQYNINQKNTLDSMRFVKPKQ